MDIKDLLARNVKLYRDRAGLTQEKLAEECGLLQGTQKSDDSNQDDALTNQSYISDIENGRRNISLDKIGTLAKALGVKPYQLFLEKDSSEKL